MIKPKLKVVNTITSSHEEWQNNKNDDVSSVAKYIIKTVFSSLK